MTGVQTCALPICWSATSTNTRYQATGLTAAQVPGLKLKWAFAFPGDVTAFSGLTVYNGTLFTGSAGGGIYALDARTGCTHWHYQANGPVRTAPLVVPTGSGARTRDVLIFSDQIGWVYGLDARTGKEIWKRKVELHDATRLTGTPVVWRDTGCELEPGEFCVVPASCAVGTRARSNRGATFLRALAH